MARLVTRQTTVCSRVVVCLSPLVRIMYFVCLFTSVAEEVLVKFYRSSRLCDVGRFNTVIVQATLWYFCLDFSVRFVPSSPIGSG